MNKKQDQDWLEILADIKALQKEIKSLNKCLQTDRQFTDVVLNGNLSLSEQHAKDMK